MPQSYMQDEFYFVLNLISSIANSNTILHYIFHYYNYNTECVYGVYFVCVLTINSKFNRRTQHFNLYILYKYILSIGIRLLIINWMIIYYHSLK